MYNRWLTLIKQKQYICMGVGVFSRIFALVGYYIYKFKNNKGNLK